MSSVIDFIKSISKVRKPGAEDTADRLNFICTPALLIMLSLVVFGKEYVGKPMYCVFSGQQTHPPGFQDFAESYCWAHGTYAYSKDAFIRLTGFKEAKDQEKYWKLDITSQLQSYYQWVPLFLLMQCILTYLPKLIWQIVCSRRFGSNIYDLIGLAAESKIASSKEFGQNAARIADVIERMLVYNREFRSGRLQRLKSTVYNRCSFLVPSKRMGTMLTVLYLLVKLLSVANAIGQLALMACFLGFWRRGILMFGWAMLQNLSSGRSWQETMFFPVQTYCYVTVKNDLQPGAHVGQCTLPVNILNEKIFILLFFWFLLLAVLTALSIVHWVFRLMCALHKVSFVKRFLRLSEPGLQVERPAVKSFIAKFLRHDGIFLVLMLSEASDKVIATEVVRLLFQRWLSKYHACDLRKRDCGVSGDKLKFGLDDSTLKSPCTSTAADESGLMSA